MKERKKVFQTLFCGFCCDFVFPFFREVLKTEKSEMIVFESNKAAVLIGMVQKRYFETFEMVNAVMP